MILGKIWDFLMRRKRVCLLFLLLLGLAIFGAVKLLQHVELPSVAQSETDYLDLPCYETVAEIGGGDNLISQTISEEVETETEAATAPTTHFGIWQLIWVIGGVTLILLLIRFIFDHYVR